MRCSHIRSKITPYPPRIQHVQTTLFHEKEKLIENCLFGVDININSVRICQLRLWVELLKNAYYKHDDLRRLETLPNIDINIKCGNSLLSRFTLDQNLSEAFKSANITVSGYGALVAQYKVTRDRVKKRMLQGKHRCGKTNFRTGAARSPLQEDHCRGRGASQPREPAGAFLA